MSAPRPSGAGAVMASRNEPPDSLDFFPTPPWATRALCEVVLSDTLGISLGGARVWEPAAGEGHMAEVLREYAREVIASDVHDYGRGYQVGSFTGAGADVIRSQPCDWIITNPPFNLAAEFVARARNEARGVAMLTRTAWLESEDRYSTLFAPHPPHVVALFAERVAMVKGRWNPRASTATSYAWSIWRAGTLGPGTRLIWIPPGQKKRLTLAADYASFAGVAP